MREMYEKLEVRRLGIEVPNELPDGHFQKVVWRPKVYVYGFVYYNTAACRETDGRLHNCLRSETINLIDQSILLHANFLSNCAGRYLWPGLPHEYMNDHDGSITIRSHPPTEALSFKRQLTEYERMNILVKVLKKEPYVVEHKIEIQTFLFKEMKVDVCPFTGGGDIFISKSVLSGAEISQSNIVVCLAKELDQTEVDTTQPDSPTSDGNFRGPSLVECKNYGSGQSRAQIELQLKANMMLVLCHQFYNTLADTSSVDLQRLSDVDVLMFGCSSTLEVYKLELNFNDRTCRYTKLFSYPVAPTSGHYVNGALSYLIKRISKFKN